MLNRAVRLAVAASLASLAAPVAAAQLIPIKTVPIAQGDQFQIFPSDNLGMGGVSIALADSLQDPFTNPALGARVVGGGARLFSAPTVYSVSGDAGGGRSLPLAVLAGRGEWYGGVALALQQVEPSRPPGFQDQFFPPPQPLIDSTGQPIPGPDNRAHGNRYFFGMVGRALPGRLSLGASALWMGLHAVDGVDLLYAGSRRVAQSGHSLDLRLGLLKEWPGDGEQVGEGERGAGGGRVLQAVLLHSRFSADHEVTYADVFWDPGTQRLLERARIEQNFERNNTWGAHLEYEMPLRQPGWRVGWLATINRASHPKIPEYELANVPVIPRDPGYSTAIDLGMGFSRVRGPATFGIDVLYEPIRSYTWADAAVPVPTAGGDTIPVGGKTIENRFRFSNALVRVGVARDIELGRRSKAAGIQFGLAVRSIHYRLHQTDNVQLTRRSLSTGWLEWTPTWGLSLRFPEFELRYRGRVTHGAGRPGVTPVFFVGVRDLALANSTILAAPSGPLNLTDVSTTTHQVSLSLPLH